MTGCNREQPNKSCLATNRVATTAVCRQYMPVTGVRLRKLVSRTGREAMQAEVVSSSNHRRRRLKMVL